MLYTEEGLYLEWKVVSFTANKNNRNSQNKLVWIVLQPLLGGFQFIFQAEPGALLSSTVCMQVLNVKAY